MLVSGPAVLFGFCGAENISSGFSPSLKTLAAVYPLLDCTSGPVFPSFDASKIVNSFPVCASKRRSSVADAHKSRTLRSDPVFGLSRTLFEVGVQPSSACTVAVCSRAKSDLAFKRSPSPCNFSYKFLHLVFFARILRPVSFASTSFRFETLVGRKSLSFPSDESCSPFGISLAAFNVALSALLDSALVSGMTPSSLETRLSMSTFPSFTPGFDEHLVPVASCECLLLNALFVNSAFTGARASLRLISKSVLEELPGLCSAQLPSDAVISDTLTTCFLPSLFLS
mmetsp:Transcript_1943/g.5819  ORF Transcript_1943/g.5819 Transcript_1943/m.5819 type:complete len:284 (+) Transcript_1943:448-1299(+)